MRLRSSQFVFLLLLVCSVQITEEYALNLVAATVSGRATDSQQRREAASAAALQHLPPAAQASSPVQVIHLDAASHAAIRAPWTMRRPALQATAVTSFTSLQRAWHAPARA